MNNRLISYLQLIAGSSFLFIFLSYFCAYSIILSFLNKMFSLPLTTVIIFPPTNMLILGYFVIFSFILALPIIWNFSKKNEFMEVIFVSLMIVGAHQITKSDMYFYVYNLYISPTISKLLMFICLAVVSFTIIFFTSRFIKKKPKAINKFFEVFPISLLAIFFALMLPTFSEAREAYIDAKSFSFISSMFVFYPEYVYVLTIISIVFYHGSLHLKEVNEIKQKLLILLKLSTVTLIFIYSFSTVIGSAVVRGYNKTGKGIFPTVDIYLYSGIDFNGVLQTDIKEVNLLSLDNHNYYIFTTNPKHFYALDAENIKYVKMN